MLQVKKGVTIVKYLWIMRGLLVLVVIDNSDVFLSRKGKEKYLEQIIS